MYSTLAWSRRRYRRALNALYLRCMEPQSRSSGIEVTSTSDPTGKGGWNKAASLAPWIGEDWSHAAYPGPGAALAVQVPVLTSTPTVRVPTASTPASAQMAPLGGRTKERLLFCGHAGAYAQDVAFYSDDGGATFNLSASTPYNQEDNVLKGMDECSMAQLNNGSVLLILRNFGGYKEHDPRGFHNPRCRDHGICKAYSRSVSNTSISASFSFSTLVSFVLQSFPLPNSCF